MSRTAVWKHIQGLNELGYEIKTVKGLGYQLKSIPDHLYPWELNFSLQSKYAISHFHTIDSTNRYARQLDPPHIVVAEEQQAGRGRMGRTWDSSPGGIYFSLVIYPNCAFEAIPALPLVVAVAITNIIRAYNMRAEIKWPNDVFVNGKKIAGILVELSGETDMPGKAIIGTGINVNQKIETYPQALQQNVTSMRDSLGYPLNRLIFFNKMLEETTYLIENLNHRMSDILDTWREYSCTLGQNIKIKQVGKTFYGIARDIDEKGALVLETEEGFQKIYSGDIVTLGN